ncbi:putative quinol monooxygenase [Pelagibacterium montanilacus]|uniref:putative quinol monooxygenase n=1 Tax=Pelagibacterium montanilacus TaxID=2185280 RepID=UPI000F8F6FEA|nr:antibiotic biosynthesis monooxygenase [Pelagibacterium montanilacus]
MYGLIGQMFAAQGRREELIAVMCASVGEMPGCLSYVVARDPKSDDGVWVTEVWDSAESHKGSLAIPEVKATIEKAMPLIARFGEHFETEPVGGHGLA